ncbi:unnamed protein product [Cylicocyclus nassatus]|uniref:Uncharacterized protein n=1 Tax=Cylicocyclus nassatus TaxID=53992 RepID=A0AA36M376_CYLNA|nr:unnamed protein product [Cylicocyclus nassatus]
MLRLLFAALCFAIPENGQSKSTNIIQIVFGSEYDSAVVRPSHIDEDFHELFDEFTAYSGVQFHKGNFRHFASLSTPTLGVFGMKDVNCEQFRGFLSGIRASRHHLEYARVECGPVTFSTCLTFDCGSYENRTFDISGQHRPHS